MVNKKEHFVQHSYYMLLRWRKDEMSPGLRYLKDLLPNFFDTTLP